MRGGKRKGAGRKAGPHGKKVSVTLWLSEDVAEFLRGEFPGKVGETVEGLVRAEFVLTVSSGEILSSTVDTNSPGE